MRDDIIEIRWHGRGGQGAITAAKIVANTAFISGYSGVIMTPTFGTERRGAPVFTSLKISKNKIYDLSPTVNPDMVVVLDHQLLEEANVTSGLKSGGLVVLNTSKLPSEFKLGDAKTATADITSLAIQAGLKPGIVNSGIIGAFAKASGFLDINLLTEEIKKEFKGKKPDENAAAAEIAYSHTIVGE